MSENAAGQGPLERPVGPHLPPDTWHWVQFETIDGDRTAPQPALWNGRHWHGVGWKGIPFDGAILCGPCTMPLKVRRDQQPAQADE